MRTERRNRSPPCTTRCPTACTSDSARTDATPDSPETIRLKVMQWSEGLDVNTVSIGVASLIPGANMHWTLLLEAADKALYAAKANGRNQSVLASMPKLSLVA